MREAALASIVSIALAVPALAGCWVDDPLSGFVGPPPPALAAGEFSVRVDAAALDVALVHGDTVLLDFPADGLELGVLPSLDDSTNYDPYTLEVHSALDPPPDGLAWLAPSAMTVTSATSDGITVALAYPQGVTAKLSLAAPATGSFQATLVPVASAGGPAVAYFRLRPRVGETEGLYGLGEAFDDVSPRGKVRGMQLEIDESTESGYNNAHVPIPFLVGTSGWGLFVESQFPGVFAVATQSASLVEATFGTGLRSGDGLTFHLFGEDQPLDLTRHYYDVTGYPRLPARWALGPWVWRHVEDQGQAESDLQTMRDLDLPATAYWADDTVASAVQTFDWDPSRFPSPSGLVDTAHALGFGFALWHSPYLDKSAAATASLRAAAQAGGYYPPVAGIPLNPWGTLIDFTNPAAYAWWQGLVEQYTAIGIEGFKLDYGEDVVPGISAGRNVWEFWDGSDERTMHARYQLFYHRVYAETLPASGSFLLCRHGTYGDQVNASVLWPGDLDSSFAEPGDPATDGTTSYVSVGGLPASITAGLTLGVSGFPFFGADTGGYLHAPPDKELFTRWFEQTALSLVMQMGNAANTVAWESDPTTGYDAEMLGWYRTYTQLHLRLFPYLWTYAENLAHDGRPIARPLGLAHPELGSNPSDTYLLGDSLLVAPVVEQGATERAVLLPAGSWIDWWTGAVVAGGATVTAEAPLGTLPLYLAEGGIVPMLRPTIATLRPVADPTTIDSYATTPGVLWARVAPGAPSSFTLFDGAALGQQRASGTVTLSASDGSEFASGVMFEVVAMGAKPAKVTDGSAPLPDEGTSDALAALPAGASGWAFATDTGGTVWVRTAPGTHRVEISP
jgi:alpha-D-xyloside xylohydrolase